MKQQLSTLQEQVNTLFAHLNELNAQKQSLEALTFEPFPADGSRPGSLPGAQPLPPAAARPRAKHPRFHGPTSSAFNFDVARSSLQNMGIAPTEDVIHDDLTTAHVTPAGSPPPQLPRQMPPAPVTPIHPSKDPIWAIKREECIRLCRVYEEEIGIMYPIFDIEKVINHTNLLYTFLEAATRTGFAQRGLPGADCLQDDDTINLKMILATTLMLEGNGQSELGRQLFENVKPIFHQKLLEPVDIKSIQLFTMVVSLCLAHNTGTPSFFFYLLMSVVKRPPTTSTATMISWPTELLVSQHACCLRWAYIVAMHWRSLSQMRTSGLRSVRYSGPSILLTDVGALVRGCHS